MRAHGTRDRTGTGWTAPAHALLLTVFVIGAIGASGANAAPSGPRVPEGAFAEGASGGGEPRIEARLIAHPEDGPLSERIRVAVLLDVDPGWHIYGPEPGESGLPTELRFEVEGARVEPVVWPPTVEFSDAGDIRTRGYAGRVWLRADVVPFQDRANGRLARVDVDLLACRDECVPTTLSLVRDLHAAEPAWSTHASQAELATLFEGPALAAVRDTDRRRGASSGGTVLGLLQALVLGLLGGIVLNAMPCVLPVLAIKLFALAELRERGRREVIEHAGAYTAGILVTMLALAGAVIALRAAGASVGWGFQLQEPLFAISIAVLLVLFALNLFGVFEIAPPTTGLARIGSSTSGLSRSFLDGLLAVLLATPCTAPFLGTAAGFALAGSASVIVAVFTAIGLGLALPFVFAALLPTGTRFMPRAGTWMLELRRGLGFALLATVVWLLWVLKTSVDAQQLVGLVGFLLAVALAAYAYGVAQRTDRRHLAAVIASACVVLAAVGFVRFTPTASAAEQTCADTARAADSDWEPFDPDEIASRLRSSQPVFVYFTADWCITCKVNESLVITNERVQRELTARGFARFRGDWTRRSETIRRELERLGRAGVPTTVIYDPERPDEPEVLPELLTVDRVLESLRRVAEPAPPAAQSPERT